MNWFTKPAPVTASNPKGQRVAKTRLTGTLAAAAIALVGSYEGLRTKAYIPIAGDVPTICYGSTKGVKLGDTATKPECDALLVSELKTFEAGMRRCLLEPDRWSDKVYLSMLSATYNIGYGPTGFCGSSMARNLNANNGQAACNSLLRWNKASGRVVPGLTKRREQERALCLAGL